MKGLVCELCGEDHPACIQFHHVNPKNKNINVSYAALQGYGKDKILKEINKCIPVCANCHTKIQMYQ